MSNKESVSGIDEKQLESKGKESLEKALNQKVEQSKVEAAPESEPDKKEPEKDSKSQEPKKTQDADNELSKYDNVLMNMYGVTEEELEKGISPDKARKLAKSWAEIQSTATKTKQEASQHKQIVDNLNAVLQKHPSLYEQLQKAAQGQYQENPINQESKDQPQPQEQLEDVSEDDLIKQGYLKADELEGLDDLAKQRKILRAEAKYIRETESKNYLNDIKTQQENLRKQQELEQIQKENELRATQGFDNFVAQYGVNFAELDDSVVKQINKRMMHTLDPDDPRKIAEDAFEISATQVLRKNGLLPQQKVQPSGKDVSQIEDTGKSFSKATQSKRNKTLDEQLRERAAQQFVQSNDPKKQFKQKFG